MTDEEWNPSKKPAPEFRGVGMTYEQFNQMMKAQDTTQRLLWAQSLTSLIHIVFLTVLLILAVYGLWWLDGHNFLSVMMARGAV